VRPRFLRRCVARQAQFAQASHFLARRLYLSEVLGHGLLTFAALLFFLEQRFVLRPGRIPAMIASIAKGGGKRIIKSFPIG
jgi:hypothetical protein